MEQAGKRLWLCGCDVRQPLCLLRSTAGFIRSEGAGYVFFAVGSVGIYIPERGKPGNQFMLFPVLHLYDEVLVGVAAKPEAATHAVCNICEPQVQRFATLHKKLWQVMDVYRISKYLNAETAPEQAVNEK